MGSQRLEQLDHTGARLRLLSKAVGLGHRSRTDRRTHPVFYASQPASLATSLLVTLGLMQTKRDAIAIVIGVLILTAVGEPMRRLLARHPPLAKNKPAVN